MSIIITPNQVASRDNRAPAPATKPDGSGFQWRMFYQSNSMIADVDSTADALEVLSSGYASLSTEEKLEDRIRLAQTVQINARSIIASRISQKTASELKDWEWDVLLYQGDPYGWGNGTGKLGEQDDESLDIWSSDIPLVLVSTSYAPHTNIIKPISIEGDYKEVKNLIWLRPEHELEFLQTLSRIGYITFGRPAVEDVYA